MALDTKSLGYLIDPAFQIEGISGKPAIGGWIEVYLAGTDTKVITFSNFDGTKNPFKIPLNNDGRAVVLAPITDSYDFYVKDSFGNLMFSRLNVVPSIGGGSVTVNGFTRITNSDDTLDIQVTGSLTGKNTYDINTNHIPLGLEEPLYWKEDEPDGAVIAVDLTDVEEKVVEAIGDRLTKVEADVENLELNKQDRLSEYQLSKIENAVDADYVISQDAATKADIMSNVYTKEETRTKINEGVNTGKADILTKVYTKQQVDTELTKKQDKLTSTQMYNVNNAVTDVSNLATKSELSSYAKKSEIPNSYTKTESDAKYQLKGNYALVGDSYTKSESDNKYALKGDVPTDVYTKTEADEKFATKEEIPEPYELPKASDTVLGGIKVGNNLSITEDGTLNANGGITEISWGSITGSLDSQTDLKNALDGKQPTGDYALKSEIIDSYSKTESDAKYQDKLTDYTPDVWNTVTDKADKTDIPTKVSELENDAGYLTEHQDISNLATKSELSDGLATKQNTLTDYTPEVWNTVTNKADKTELSNYYPITGGNVNGKVAATGTGSASKDQAAVIYAKVTNTSTNNQSGLGTNGSVWGGDYANATSQTIGVRRKVGDKRLAGRFQLYSDGNVSFQQIENNGTSDSIVCQLQYGETTNGFNWGTMTYGTSVKHIAFTEDLDNKTYTGQNGVEVDNTNNKIGLDSTTYANVNKINSAKELVAGDNITISEVGNDIVISSTGGSTIPIGTIEV